MAACGRARVAVGDHGVGVPGPRARGLARLHGLDLPSQHQVVEAVQVLGGDGAPHFRQERELGMETSRAVSRSSTSRRAHPLLLPTTAGRLGHRLPSSLRGSPCPGRRPRTLWPGCRVTSSSLASWHARVAAAPRAHQEAPSLPPGTPFPTSLQTPFPLLSLPTRDHSPWV